MLLVEVFLFFIWHNSPTRAWVATCLRFLDHTQLHITVGRTPLDEGSARRRDLYLRTHNSYKRQTSMVPAGLFFCSFSVLYLYCFVLIVLALPFMLIVQHTTQTSIPPVGFELAIPENDRPQTALHSSATGIGWIRTRIPSKRAVVDPRLRPLGLWDRQRYLLARLKPDTFPSPNSTNKLMLSAKL
jgi:hypothetical protein